MDTGFMKMSPIDKGMGYLPHKPPKMQGSCTAPSDLEQMRSSALSSPRYHIIFVLHSDNKIHIGIGLNKRGMGKYMYFGVNRIFQNPTKTCH